MNFKIGDLVRFVDEPIEGRITSIQPNDIVGVTDDTGFEIPVLKSKITFVHGNMRMPEDDLDELPRLTNQPFVDKGIYLGIAGEQQRGLAKFYLINETSYELLVSISSLTGAKTTGLFAQSIPRNDFTQCYTANFSSIGQWPTFYIQIIRHCSTEHILVQPLSKEIRIRLSDLSHAKERIDMLQEKLWLFELDAPNEDIGLDKLKSHFISHRPKRS